MQCGRVNVEYNPFEDEVRALDGELRSPRLCRAQPSDTVLQKIQIPHRSVNPHQIIVPISPMKRPLTSIVDTRVKPVPRRRPLVRNVYGPQASSMDLAHDALKDESETKNHNKELVWFHHRWLTKHGKDSSMKEKREKMVLMRRWFEFLDTDGSGEIGLNELEDPLVSVGLAKCRMDVRKLIQTVDDSDNGEVNFDEFLTMMRGKNKTNKNKRVNYNLTDPKCPIVQNSQMSNVEVEDNSVVQLFHDLQAGKLGDLTLPFPILITAYRRRMLLNAHMAASETDRYQGHSVLTALEVTRREAAIQEEEDAVRALQRKRQTSTDISQRVAGMLRREDVHSTKLQNHPALNATPPAKRGLRLPDIYNE